MADEAKQETSKAQAAKAQADGPVEKARAEAEKARLETKVVRGYPDGSSDESTLGALQDSHGDPMGGPTVGDLNPAYDPAASTHAGAAK